MKGTIKRRERVRCIKRSREVKRREKKKVQKEKKGEEARQEARQLKKVQR